MREFWNHKSKSYPTPTDESGLETPKKVLDKLSEFNLSFKDKSVLDIGCGTGIYSSLIAKEAKSVLGVDISAGMLSKLNEYIREFNISNIETLELDFREFDSGNKFDIVLSAMTPAINSKDDLLSMMNLSNKNCIYIGFAGRRESPIMDKILAYFGFSNQSKDGFANMVDILKELNLNYREAFFEHNWHQIGTLEESKKDVIEHFKMRNLPIHESKIEELLKPHLRNSLIKRETFAKIGLLTWDV